MSEGEKPLSRRQLLLRGIGLVGAAIAGGIGLNRIHPSPLGKPQEKPPTPPPTPQLPTEAARNPEVKPALAATAQALNQKGEISSFKPEGILTKEKFDQLRESTFAVVATIGGLRSLGTGSCVDKEGDFLYIQTNKHIINDLITQRGNGFPPEFQLWRPYIDTSRIMAEDFSIAVSDTSDLAVVKCKVSPQKFSKEVKALPTHDNYQFKKGDKAIMCGFPGVFRENSPSQNGVDFSALGEVLTLETDPDPHQVWYAKAYASSGASGAPIATLDSRGDLQVTGVLFGGENDADFKEGSETKRYPAVYGVNLKTNKLINQLKTHNITH